MASVGVRCNAQLGWGAKIGLDKFTPIAAGSSVQKSRASASGMDLLCCPGLFIVFPHFNTRRNKMRVGAKIVA